MPEVMLEFDTNEGHVLLDRRTIVSVDPSGDRALVTLRNGRHLLATIDYQHLRQLLLDSTS